MVPAIIGLVLLIVLVLIAIRMISLKRPPSEDNGMEARSTGTPLIHASGIYSIVRKSPRQDLQRIRPPESEIRKYLASINEDINRNPLTDADRAALLEKWQQSKEENIRVVEQGDNEGLEFYFFDSPTEKICAVCAPHFNKGQFVSRQEIFNNPSVIPPFHPGCNMRLLPYHGKENLRDTTILGMTPFFKSSAPPTLPDWKKVIKIA